MLIFFGAVPVLRTFVSRLACPKAAGRRPKTCGRVLLIAVPLLLASHLFSAEVPTVPADLQAAIFKKIFTYTKTLSPEAASRVIVVHDDSQAALVEQLRTSFQQVGIQTVGVHREQLDSQLPEGAILYVAIPDASFKRICKEKHVLSITGFPALVEKGEVAIGLTLIDSKPKILVNLSEVRAEGHDLSAQLLQLAKIIP